MTDPEKVRRAGYAPASVELGRRGLHTREAIVQSAARLFRTEGFHATSIDAIAKAAGGSRATVYQYFQNKEDIYRELAAQCAPAVLEHGAQLGRLGPDDNGFRNLYDWLDRWTKLYDEHAAVLLEFPGIGPSSGILTGPGPVSDQYSTMIADRLAGSGIAGLTPADATAVLMRVAHMVNLYRYRGMFDLPDAPVVTRSLAISMQLLLFPETPPEVLTAFGSQVPHTYPSLPHDHSGAEPDTETPLSVSPIRADIASAASVLFAAHGYYAVSMDDIASAASVGRATLYRHFSTKVAVLSELTHWAVIEGVGVAADLRHIAGGDCSAAALHGWLARYVRFHRTYSGVIRTWYDGGLSRQIADAVSTGIGPFQVAATQMLAHLGVPAGVDLRVAASIFLGVLGRITELTIARQTDGDDYAAAELMLAVLTRAFALRFPRVSD